MICAWKLPTLKMVCLRSRPFLLARHFNMTGTHAVLLRRCGIVDARASWGAALRSRTGHLRMNRAVARFTSSAPNQPLPAAGLPRVAIPSSETILGLASLWYRAKKRRRALRYESWTATSPDGKIVRFAYKELSDGVAGISAKTDGRFVMILQRSIRAPLTRKQVEAVFERATFD